MLLEQEVRWGFSIIKIGTSSPGFRVSGFSMHDLSFEGKTQDCVLSADDYGFTRRNGIASSLPVLLLFFACQGNRSSRDILYNILYHTIICYNILSYSVMDYHILSCSTI